MPCSELGGNSRRLPIHCMDLTGKRSEELIHLDRCVFIMLERFHKHLGVRRCRQHERVARLAGVAKRELRGLVVHVVRVEDGDDDARVENGQRHSLRSFSSRPGS